MISIGKIMNPNHTNKESDVEFFQDTKLLDINPQQLIESNNEYANVKNSDNEIVGAVKRERLFYLLSKMANVKLATVLDALEVGIVVIDNDSRIYYVNPAYEEILGVEIAKVIGRYMSIIEPEAALLNVLKTGKRVKVENQLIKSVNKYVSTNIYPIMEDGTMAGAFSIFTDVTELNLLNKEVERISGVADEYSRQIQLQDILAKNHVVGECKQYMECISKASKVAQTEATVLVRGENGVGKEIITRIIRENSLRKDKPFILVNCSAIPEALIESELFGYEEGSFTGASKGGKMGKFQLADGGILFLDEIGDIPIHMQAKLLRVLQEGQIEKIGRQENIPIDVRVIAATNKPLEDMVQDGTFREDLYYRLNVININVPPLRARGNDVILLAEHFLGEYNQKYYRKAVIDKLVYQKFLEYTWPGNVRELKNTIESAVVLCNDDVITINDLPEHTLRRMNITKEERAEISLMKREYGDLKEEVEIFEKMVIEETLRRFEGDKSKTMEALGLSVRTFYRKTANLGTKNK